MCAHYLFDAEFCNVASGWEKGIVEKNVQDSRRQIWTDAGKPRPGSFAGTECLARQRVPGAVGGHAPPRVTDLIRWPRCSNTSAAPDAHARAV